MRVFAPGKINLHLRVGPPRADGFHPLLSWMCTIGLLDEIEIEPAESEITLQCNDPTIPTDGSNLVVRAAAALGTSAKIKLKKRIPAGGGLAGGSSDAAATLLALNQKLSRDELVRLAATLGSDVAFFFHGPSSICTGVGEQVRPVDPPQCKWALLILPDYPSPTPAVYRKFDEMKLGNRQAIEIEPDWSHWTKLDAMQLLPNLVNDLEIPAFSLRPELARLREECERKLQRPVRMSGSGSTLFTLYDSQNEATAAAGQNKMMRVVELAPLPKDH